MGWRWRTARILALVTTVGGLAVGSRATAHPVAYQGSRIFNAFHQPDMLDWQALYSWERNVSLGVELVRDAMTGPERYFLMPRVSWLVHRWNGKDYQANVYLTGGVGVAHRDRTVLAAQASAEADYETRSIYFAAKASTFVAADERPLPMMQLRAGLAPYEGAYDDVQAWLIAQAQFYPNALDEPVRVGPVLRVFYRSVLGELGVSARGTWSFNFMVHW